MQQRANESPFLAADASTLHQWHPAILTRNSNALLMIPPSNKTFITTHNEKVTT